MMSTRVLDQNPLINELSQGKELVNELRLHLNPTSPNGEVLLGQLLSSLNKAIFMLNSNGVEAEIEPQQIVSSGGGVTESPRSGSRSPGSEGSEYKDAYKKRKMLPRWTEQVQVSSESGLEGPLEDGYSWRKYGQKDILGAKYPRGYYRCTHRTAHGCVATKQVQRCDDNPSVFDVTYRGKHTCIQTSHMMHTLQSSPKQDRKQRQDQQEQKNQKQSVLLNFRTGLKVKTEDLENRQFSSPFSFPSTSSMECEKSESNIFAPFGLDNAYMGSFSPSFISPTTSESNYFSPCHMNSFGSAPSFHNSESGATSSSNSPIMDLEFAIEPIEFDPSFLFDNPEFFKTS